MALRHVDDERVDRFGDVDRVRECPRRREEDLSLDEVGSNLVVSRQRRRDRTQSGNLSGEEDAGQDHADQNTFRQVTGRDHDGDSAQHDDRGGKRVGPEPLQRAPGEGVDRHHDHDGGQCGHRNDGKDTLKDHQQDQQDRPGDEGGQPAPSPGRHVDDGLADHGAAAHASEQGGRHVRDTLSHAFPALVARGIGHVVDDLGGQKRLQQPDRGQRQCNRGDDTQCLERERDMRHAEARKGRRQLSQVGDRADVKVQCGRQQREEGDCDQGRRDRFGDVRKAVDHQQAERDEPVGGGRNPGELRELSQEYQDRERVDEAGHDRLRHETHHPAELEDSGYDLEHAHQDRRGEQILHTVFAYDPDHQHCGGRRRGRDHCRATACEGNDASDQHRRIEADLGINPGDHGEAYRFRDERQCDHDAG